MKNSYLVALLFFMSQLLPFGVQARPFMGTGSSGAYNSLEAPQVFVPPAIVQKFILGQEQKVNPRKALRNFRKALPSSAYSRISKLMGQFSDDKIAIVKKGNTMLLRNEHSFLTIEFIDDSQGNLTFKMNGKKFRVDGKKDLYKIIASLEKRTKKSNVAFDSYYLFQLPLMISAVLAFTQEAEASNWFFVGGMAALGLAIVWATHKFSKAIKKTEHNINVKTEHKVKADDMKINIGAKADVGSSTIDHLTWMKSNLKAADLQKVDPALSRAIQ